MILEACCPKCKRYFRSAPMPSSCPLCQGPITRSERVSFASSRMQLLCCVHAPGTRRHADDCPRRVNWGWARMGNWDHGSIPQRQQIFLTAKGRAAAFRQKYGVEA